MGYWSDLVRQVDRIWFAASKERNGKYDIDMVILKAQKEGRKEGEEEGRDEEVRKTYKQISAFYDSLGKNLSDGFSYQIFSVMLRLSSCIERAKPASKSLDDEFPSLFTLPGSAVDEQIWKARAGQELLHGFN